MANFCINCGTKLEKDASFCTNCGTKVDKIDKKPKGLFGKLIREIQIVNDEETKKAKRELKRIVGGKKLNDMFITELERKGLTKNDGIRIKSTLNAEINSGEIKRKDVRNRVDELLAEYKTKLEEEIEEFKFIDELLESDEIKSNLEEEKLIISQVFSIKSNLKNKVRFSKTKMSKDEIIKEFKTELEKEKSMVEIKKKEERRIITEYKFNKNRVKYLEDIIKDSCPNIKLTTFEKEYINNIILEKDIDSQLNTIAKGIINTRKKIGDYDFVGILLEEGRLTTKGSELRLVKPVTMGSSRSSNVFLKIFDNRIKIVGSEIKAYFSCSTGRDMTIYFTEITSINYTNDLFGEIYFDLNNQSRLKLREIGEDEKYLIEFYNLLRTAWEKFKNNETDKNSSINEKNYVSTADELMKYAELYEKGIISEDELNIIKKKLLGL